MYVKLKIKIVFEILAVLDTSQTLERGERSIIQSENVKVRMTGICTLKTESLFSVT